MDPLLLMLLFFAVMMIPMFLMGRGQRKRMAEHQEMLKTLQVGDEVKTHSGFYGMIVDEDEDTFTLETESGAQLKWSRNAVAQKVASYGEEVEDSPLESDGEVPGVTS